MNAVALPSRRVVASGLVVFTTAGLLVGLTAHPAQASGAGDEVASPVQPDVVPNPSATEAIEGGEPATSSNESVQVAPVAPPAEAGTLRSQAKAAAGSREKVEGIRIKPTLSPGGGRKFGVAQVVTMRFPVSINRKARVEKFIEVVGRTKNGKPRALPKGRWGWVDDRTAVYRTKSFWPANTSIKFKVNLRNRLIAKYGKTRYVGSDASEFVHKLRTGRRLVITVNNGTHKIYVRKNGKKIRTFGTSLGKSGYETRSGVKVLGDTKYKMLRMRGRDRFTGETWDVMSPYSIPLTTNGEFIHGAPWARHRIGYANGSHGCTNMNVEDVRWLFYKVRRGDPVVTKGTGRKMYDGLAFTEGKPWAYSWRQWKAKSAL